MESITTRTIKALLIGLLYGISGVLIDLDHLLCAVLGLGIWKPSEGQFGCRLLHPYLLDGGWFLLSISFAFIIGQTIAYLIYLYNTDKSF